MNMIYNAAMSMAKAVVPLFAGKGESTGDSKFRKFVKGQKDILRHIADTFSNEDRKPVIWIHAASLGEYGVARPIIKKLKAEGKYLTVLTFFSPSGYEALKKRKDGPDYVFYLPLDEKRNVRRFLNIIHPDKAVFIISEYWPNYLEELRNREIPTFLISALITRRSVFFKWYGGIFRKCLNTFNAITVLNEESLKNLESMGYRHAVLTGDPLFDNVAAAAATPFSDSIVEEFTRPAEGRVLIAGSTSDQNDTRMVTELANRHKDTRFIIVPHEITEQNTKAISSMLTGRTAVYSKCGADTSLYDAQVLIIDRLGILPFLYRYARLAYIGGGFTPFLHNILEATVYGLPASFGPETGRKTVPQDLIRLGIGQTVKDEDELDAWFNRLNDNEDDLRRIRDAAKEYLESKCGATSAIMDIIESY